MDQVACTVFFGNDPVPSQGHERFPQGRAADAEHLAQDFFCGQFVVAERACAQSVPNIRQQGLVGADVQRYLSSGE